MEHGVGTVVLLHGIARSSDCMEGMGRYLERRGWKVLNVDYPSTRHEIHTLAEHCMWPEIQRYCAVHKEVGDTEPLHFVGYSMGGLLIRDFLKHHRPKNLGRVVMLGTPNQGSEVADFWKNHTLYHWIFGPAGQELGTEDVVMETVDFPLGIIAGNRNLDPLGTWFIPGEGDGKVAVARTVLNGMADHIVLPVSHLMLPYNEEVRRQVSVFLSHGHFDKSPAKQ